MPTVELEESESWKESLKFESELELFSDLSVSIVGISMFNFGNFGLNLVFLSICGVFFKIEVVCFEKRVKP